MMPKKKTPKTPPKAVTQNVPDEERILTVKEVAELDRCSEKTVRRAINDGLMDAMRIGPGKRLLRITREALAKYRGANHA
jgi:excisionase family DNA binding protein